MTLVLLKNNFGNISILVNILTRFAAFRRKMAAALPLGNEQQQNFKTSSSDGLEVAENFSRFMVIGAGMSGLAAAAHLSKNDCSDYKVLEARNRIGGRIMTVQIGNEFKHFKRI